MILKTYLDKVNTIVEESDINTGFNPIGELIYGAITTRMLIHFDTNKIKKELDKNGIVDYSNVKHVLKITNCGIIETKQLYRTEDSIWGNGVKLRASSFDLIFFLVPQEWDGGKGFDYSLNFFNQGCFNVHSNNIDFDASKLVSSDGCNWYQARNGYDWDEKGIYENITLSREYDKFSSNENSIIIARQHFDVGNENINVDISDTVNKFLNGELNNYGLGIAFTPMTELNVGDDENYVGFFTHKTNTFFEPFVETTYENAILDDRSNFVLNKNNKLYLYCNIGGYLTNLDELPTCTIEGAQMPVKQASEGVYYIDLLLSSKDYEPNTMLYDVWGNIKYNGVVLDDVELDFVTKTDKGYFNIGNNVETYKNFEPLLCGIKYDEKILRGDKRKISVISKNEYSRNKASLVDNLKYRLYVKDGEREITVINFHNVNRTLNENYFIIDTSMLIPNRYYIDVKYDYKLEEIQHCNVLSFEIISDINKKYIE